MQRQSVGSPSSKLEQFTTPDSPNHILPPSSSSSTPTALTASLYGVRQIECSPEEEDALKKKLLRPPKTYIHLIPMLTLLCFLILYLSSHYPSPVDLAEFNGFKPSSDLQLDEANVSELEGIVEIKKGDILGVRSLKNSERATNSLWRQRHRKMARV